LLLFDIVRDELATRQVILKQMLIDTNHIDHLRVNFVSHFQTENNSTIATNEITEILDNYPKEMTSELRQWLTEQQKTNLTAPLATVDASKSIDDFDEYIKEIEENILSYEQNENNEKKLKEILQQIEEQPNLPQNLNNKDQQRVENLHQRFLRAQKHIEDIRKKSSPSTNTNHIIENVDLLIKHLRDIEEQIRANAIQPINDYERLILDCQVRIQVYPKVVDMFSGI
jgi:hypothetical protein